MSLQDFYSNLTLEQIEAFVEEREVENLNLEFKTVNRSNFTNSNDKKNFAKALSGFANSSGGIVVWGVRADKNEDDLDCATEIVGIDQCQLFLTRLNEHTGIAVSPIVDGVLHRAIEIDGDRGLVVTYVPESDSGPHMAKLKEDRYFKRSGDSFYKMEHFDIADMFGRRKKPVLKFHARVEGRGIDVEIIIGIENVGRGTAKAPYLAFNVPPPFRRHPYGLDGNRNDGLPPLTSTTSGYQRKYVGGANNVVHPGVVLEVTRINLGSHFNGDLLPIGDIEIPYQITAEDISIMEGTFTVAIP